MVNYGGKKVIKKKKPASVSQTFKDITLHAVRCKALQFPRLMWKNLSLCRELGGRELIVVMLAQKQKKKKKREPPSLIRPSVPPSSEIWFTLTWDVNIPTGSLWFWISGLHFFDKQVEPHLYFVLCFFLNKTSKPRSTLWMYSRFLCLIFCFWSVFSEIQGRNVNFMSSEYLCRWHTSPAVR